MFPKIDVVHYLSRVTKRSLLTCFSDQWVLFPLNLNVLLGFAPRNIECLRETKPTVSLRASHKRLIIITIKVKNKQIDKSKHGNLMKLALSLLKRGTPDNGLQFQVVQRKNVHAVWLIRTATNSKKLFSRIYPTQRRTLQKKRLHMPLTSSLCCHNDENVNSIVYLLNQQLALQMTNNNCDRLRRSLYGEKFSSARQALPRGWF